MKITSLAATVAFLAFSAAAQADVIANWTFETSIPATAGPHIAEAGVNAAISQASGFHVLTSVVYSNPVGNGSAESFSSNFWSTGDYYQFTTSLTGYQNASITFDQTNSSTGPSGFKVAVSTDGVNFTDLSSYTTQVNGAPNTAWNGTTYNPVFTIPAVALTGTDNAGSVTVRLIQTSATGATGGTNRVDNVVINADAAVPEPATMGLLALGVAALARRKRN